MYKTEKKHQGWQSFWIPSLNFSDQTFLHVQNAIFQESCQMIGGLTDWCVLFYGLVLEKVIRKSYDLTYWVKQQWLMSLTRQFSHDAISFACSSATCTRSPHCMKIQPSFPNRVCHLFFEQECNQRRMGSNILVQARDPHQKKKNLHCISCQLARSTSVFTLVQMLHRYVMFPWQLREKGVCYFVFTWFLRDYG